MGMTKTNAADWTSTFTAALARAAKQCGCDITSLRFERCTTDATWGDRCGLVFYGASDAVNERAARFFEKWAAENLRKLGVVGVNYGAQASISYEGEFYFCRYENGAQGWHRDRDTVDFEKMTVTTSYGYVSHPIELRRGFATSYVYYPGAE